MSDRSAFTLIVYDCPPEQRAAVLEIINEHGLTEDYFDGEEETALNLGTRYGYGEMLLTAYQDVADQIIEKAPGATFECWNDPKYEYSGAVTMYAPDLGRFTSDCDADGEPYVTAPTIRKLIVNTGEEDLALGLEQALGVTWSKRFAEIAEKARDLLRAAGEL